MNRYAVWIILGWAILSPLCPVLADDRVSEITEGIRKRYGGLPGLTVAYNREIITRSMAMLDMKTARDQAAGLIRFKPPYCLRIEQEKPKSEAVITDGTSLWWYIPDKRQVFIYPTVKSSQELRLLSDIFRGLREVHENFVVMLSEPDRDGETELKLIPDPPWSQIEYIHLRVNKQDFHITAVEIHHYVGDVTRFTLGDLSVKDKFDEGFCRFEAPEGVEVIKEGG